MSDSASRPTDAPVPPGSVAGVATGPLRVRRLARTLEVTFAVPVGVQGIEVGLESERNRAVPRLTERSPYALPAFPLWHEEQPDRDLWFPVVDVALEPQMEGLAVLRGLRAEDLFSVAGSPGDDWDGEAGGAGSGGAHYVVNGAYYRAAHPLAPALRIPATQLEHWENALFVRWLGARWGDERPSLERFSLRARYPMSGGQVFRHAYGLLSEAWSGAVAVWAVEPDAPGRRRLLASATVASSGGATAVVAPSGRHSWDTPALQRATATVPPPAGELDALLSPERLRASVAASVGYLLRSRNGLAWSPTRGGLFLFYDLDAGTYRSAHWTWGTGPAVRLLLAARGAPGLPSLPGAGALLEAARGVCESQLRFAVDDPAHPAFGGAINRYVVGYRGPGDREKHGGYAAFVSPADAGWDAGWAWVPLYEATGERRYLEAAERWAALVERLVDTYEVVPQDFLPWHGGWTPHTIDENGFGTEGFAELYRVTGDPRYRRVGRRYIDQCVEKLGRGDGLWDRRYDWETGEARATGYMTRGMGWAMEGLLAAQRLAPDGPYLQQAVAMAEHLLRAQQPAGCWSFAFTRPPAEVGVTAKGTALWALLLFGLQRATGDPRHLAAARRALAWCVANQYPATGPDAEAAGSLPGCSLHSGVHYREWFRVACAYGSAFFGLAALEELARTTGLPAGA